MSGSPFAGMTERSGDSWRDPLKTEQLLPDLASVTVTLDATRRDPACRRRGGVTRGGREWTAEHQNNPLSASWGSTARIGDRS